MIDAALCPYCGGDERRCDFSFETERCSQMIDATKFPKTARLQQQREEKYEREQARQKMEAKEKQRMLIKQRSKRAHDKVKAETQRAKENME